MILITFPHSILARRQVKRYIRLENCFSRSFHVQGVNIIFHLAFYYRFLFGKMQNCIASLEVFTPGLSTTSKSNSNRWRRLRARCSVKPFRFNLHLSAWWLVRILNWEPSGYNLNCKTDQTTATVSMCVVSYRHSASNGEQDQ